MMNILIYTNYFSFPAFFNYSNYSVCFIVSLFFSLDITHNTTIYTILPIKGINNKRKYKNHFFSSISLCLRTQAKNNVTIKRNCNITIINIDITIRLSLVLMLKSIIGRKLTARKNKKSKIFIIKQFKKKDAKVFPSIFPLKSK